MLRYVLMLYRDETSDNVWQRAERVQRPVPVTSSRWREANMEGQPTVVDGAEIHVRYLCTGITTVSAHHPSNHDPLDPIGSGCHPIPRFSLFPHIFLCKVVSTCHGNHYRWMSSVNNLPALSTSSFFDVPSMSAHCSTSRWPSASPFPITFPP